MRRQRCQRSCTGNGQGWRRGLKQLRSAAGSVGSAFWALLRSGVLVPLVSNGAVGSNKVPADLAPANRAQMCIPEELSRYERFIRVHTITEQRLHALPSADHAVPSHGNGTRLELTC